MSKKQKMERPFALVSMAQSTLSMAVQYPEAFNEENLRKLVADAHIAMGYLMDFRNIVNSMAGLDEEPQDAALVHIRFDKIKEAASREF